MCSYSSTLVSMTKRTELCSSIIHTRECMHTPSLCWLAPFTEGLKARRKGKGVWHLF